MGLGATHRPPSISKALSWYHLARRLTMLHTLAGGAFCTHGTAAMAKVYPWACMSKPTMASSATLAVSAAHPPIAAQLERVHMRDMPLVHGTPW